MLTKKVGMGDFSLLVLLSYSRWYIVFSP